MALDSRFRINNFNGHPHKCLITRIIPTVPNSHRRLSRVGLNPTLSAIFPAT